MRGHVLSFVVDVAPGIDILTVGLVEDFSGESVLGVVGDIVVGEVDDLVFRDTELLEDLVGVASISLVPVVPVTV